jgi:hypothetical protein
MGAELTFTPPERTETTHTAGFFDSREEKTLAGALIGEVRDVFGKPKTEEARKSEARANDDYAHLIADTAAMIPRVRLLAAAGLRAAMLANPHEGLLQNGELGCFNALGGVALAQLSKFQTASFLSKQKTTKSLSLVAEASSNFGYGLSFGATRSSFDNRTWVDADGNNSLLTGLKNIATSALIGGVANIPAAMISNRTVRLFGPTMGESALERVAIGVASGAGSGAMFGAIDGALHGHTIGEIGLSMLDGMQLGAITGGTLSALPMVRSTSFREASQPQLKTGRDLQPDAQSPQAVQKFSRPLIDDGTFDTTKIQHLITKHEAALGFKEPLSQLGSGQLAMRLPKPIETMTQRLALPAGAPDKFQTTTEFLDALQIEQVKALRYDLLVPEPGMKSKFFQSLTTQPDKLSILIDKDYAQRLSEARAQKDGSSASSSSKLELANRALPEDVLRSVLRVPDRARLGTIHITDEFSLEDLAKRRVIELADPKSARWQTAASITVKSGETQLYRPSLKTVDADILHEQVHRTQEGLELKHQKDGIFARNIDGDQSIDTYDMARQLDPPVEASEYGYSKSIESEAELESKTFLSQNLAHFFEGAERAPIRFASIARRLSATINSARPENRSIDAQEMLARANYVEKHVIPGAVDKVINAIESGKAPDVVPLLGRLAFEPNAKANEILVDELAQGGKRMRIAATGLARMDWRGNLVTLQQVAEEVSGYQERAILVDDMLDAQKSPREAQALAAALAKAGSETKDLIIDVFERRHWFNSPEAVNLLAVPPELTNADAAEKIRYVLHQKAPQSNYENQSEVQSIHQQQAMALKLLRFNGNASDIPMLERLAVEERGGSHHLIPRTSHDALTAAAALQSPNPHQQFDYLKELARSNSELWDVATHVLTGEKADYPNEWTSVPEAEPLSDTLAPLSNQYMGLEIVAEGLKGLPDAESRQLWFDTVVPRLEQNNYIGTERNDIAFGSFAQELADLPELQSRITELMKRLPTPQPDAPEHISLY